MSIKWDNVYSAVSQTEHTSESAVGPIKTQIAGPYFPPPPPAPPGFANSQI